MIRRIGIILLAMAGMLPGALDCPAQDQSPPTIHWLARDIGGAEVKIPADSTSVLVFVQSGQAQSDQAIREIQKIMSDGATARVLVIFSGPSAAEAAGKFTAPQGWMVIADPDFASSGRMSVHAWPTTVVIKSDGTQVEHLAGIPPSFQLDLRAYLDFASGSLDAQGLQKRLTAQSVVTEDDKGNAARHLQLAQLLYQQGDADHAKSELAEARKTSVDDANLRLAMARLFATLNQPDEAIKILDELGANSVPQAEMNLVRARALIAQEKWASAKSLLSDVLKSTFESPEAHYLLGLCLQHDEDFSSAASEFRKAFELRKSGP